MRLLVVLLLSATAFLLLVWFTQRRLIYFPSRVVPDPVMVGSAQLEEARFTAEDGVALHGWFATAEGEARDLAVLVSHGNGGNVAHRRHLLEGLSAAGLHVLVYDYRGYGKSEGSPSEAGLYRDGRAAQAWLLERTGLPAGRLVQYGESLGAAVALELARAAPAPRALVLESPFTSLADVAGLHYPWLPVSLLLRDEYDNAGKIGRLAVPLLVMHGTHDSIVPPGHGRTLVERAAGRPRRLVEVRGSDHNDLWRDERARVADVLAFLAEVEAAETAAAAY
jgi:uncharacterized protein